MSTLAELLIRLQPKQSELWNLWDSSPYTRIGFGGSRGGSKSGGGRRCMILRRLKYPNTNGLILRRTFKQLYESHIVEMFREFPILRDWWDAGHKAINFPNGSILFFGYAEHAVDMENFYGGAYADIMPDEAQMFAWEELERLSKSNRCTSNHDIVPKMIYPFMPGVGRGLSSLKRVLVDGDLMPEEKLERWAFIQAFSWDNIEWARKELERDGISEDMYYALTNEQRQEYFLTRTEYGRNLASTADQHLRDAWLYGKWNVFEGQVFPMLKDELHNLDNFVGPNWRPPLAKMLGAVDWADSGITGAEQCAVDPDENLFFLGEYHQRNRNVLEHTVDITALFNSFGTQEYVIMDLPVNNINQHNLFSIQDAFRRAGLNTIQAHRANIAIGLDLMKQMLAVDPNRFHPFTGELGSPRLFISKRRSQHLWRQMSELQQVVDQETGKVSYIGEEDNLDPARYIAMSRPLAPARPKIIPTKLAPFSFDRKAVGAMGRFDLTFGKDTNANEWFPKQ